MFHRLCSVIAVSSPAIGATMRSQRRWVITAIANPMPVMQVNTGWVNGASTPRMKNVAARGTPPWTAACE